MGVSLSLSFSLSIYIYIYIFVYNTCVCVRTCMRVCVRACERVCVHAYVRVRNGIHGRFFIFCCLALYAQIQNETYFFLHFCRFKE